MVEATDVTAGSGSVSSPAGAVGASGPAALDAEAPHLVQQVPSPYSHAYSPPASTDPLLADQPGSGVPPEVTPPGEVTPPPEGPTGPTGPTGPAQQPA